MTFHEVPLWAQLIVALWLALLLRWVIVDARRTTKSLVNKQGGKATFEQHMGWRVGATLWFLFIWGLPFLMLWLGGFWR